MIDVKAEQVANAVFEALNARDAGAFISLLSEDAVFDFPGTRPIAGPERIERFLRILFCKYPTLRFEVGRVIADERRAAAEWTNAGETREGAPYRNAGVTVIELRDGRIVYLSDTFKDTSSFVKAVR
jgi:steroid delta-isomerase-like uncharacterized protein